MSRFWLSTGVLIAGGVLTLWMATRATSAFAQGRSGGLQVLKNCSNYTGQAGSFCTIQGSNVPELVGARVYYDQTFGIPNPNPPGGMLDSNVLLYAGTGNWAVGRCTVDGNTARGLCIFSDGVGTLTGFQARVVVGLAAGANNWRWDGAYHFGNNFIQ